MAKMTLDELRAQNPSLTPKREGHPTKAKQVLSHAGLPRADEAVVPVPDVAGGEVQAPVNATAVEAPGTVVMDVAPAIVPTAPAPKRRK